MEYKETFVNENKFREAYISLGNFVSKKGWVGCCHATAAILYVIAERLGIESTPCIGEVAYLDFPPFDHSWLVIDNKIYDIAISFPLIEETRAGSVYKDIDIETGKKTEVIYGVNYMGLDKTAEEISKKDIYSYISSRESIVNLKDVLLKICKECNIHIDEKWIKENFSNKYWSVIRDGYDL